MSSHHCSNDITSTAFMTSHTLYMTSQTWQHRSYICNLTLSIWHYIHCLFVIKPSVSILLHPLSVWLYTLYVWHHIQYAWHHMNTLWHHTCIGMTSHPVYLWHHIQYIFQYIWYHPYCFMKKSDYTSHLTHCIWHHRHCICVVTPALSMPSQKLWKSSNWAQVWHHTHPTSHQIQTLWHQSSVFRTSQALHSWHQISYIWHHIHGLWHLIPYTCDITATISVT